MVESECLEIGRLPGAYSYGEFYPDDPIVGHIQGTKGVELGEQVRREMMQAILR
jgi:hypothetical protein